LSGFFCRYSNENISNIKRQKPRSPDLIGARMSENIISAIDTTEYYSEIDFNPIGF
jgi:hypothetical protein